MYYQILPTKIVYPKIPSNIPIDKIDIIIPAINTPIQAAKKDFFLSISSIAAIRHPVQAPVPGNGIPTKRTNPQKPYFSIFPYFCSTFLSSQSTNLLKQPTLLVRILSIIDLINQSIKGTGNIFPI